MMPYLGNHIWQSTLFCAVAAFLAFVFRHHRARIRHYIWVIASIKFLIPFSLLVSVGGRLPQSRTLSAPPQVLKAVEQIGAPTVTVFSVATATPRSITPVVMLIWVCGFGGVLSFWFLRWVRIRRIVRSAAPLPLGLPIGAKCSTAFPEPGVVGILRPVLLLPKGIEQRLTPAQLRAIIAHELCHVRHHDNLTAAVHMLVESLFWFHPVVWWIGARLVDERERACDEAVLAQGEEPQSYAEGILTVCKFYLASPLPCVSGVAGADLRRRIERIMSNRVALDLTRGRKVLLILVAISVIAVPALIGIVRAQEPRLQFEVASIKPNKENAGTYIRLFPERLVITNMSVREMITWAYQIGDFQIEEAPAWIASEHYDIEANTGIPAAGEQKERRMLRSLLADRFALRVHIGSRKMPVYALTIGKAGSKLQESRPGGCVEIDPNKPPDNLMANRKICGSDWLGRNMIAMTRASTGNLAKDLSYVLNRSVVDRTELTGLYDVDLKFAPDEAIGEIGGSHSGQLVLDGAEPSIFTAIEEQLGLKLDATRDQVEVIIVDQIERPSEN